MNMEEGKCRDELRRYMEGDGEGKKGEAEKWRRGGKEKYTIMCGN